MDISRLRLNGSSGMDIDGMVQKLMQANKAPLNKLLQKKQAQEWQRDDYRAMNAKIMELRTTSFDMTLQKSFDAMKATTTSDALTVSGSTSAIEGTYKIKVNELATSASLTSGDLLVGAGDSTKTIAALGLTSDTTLTISGQKGTATIAVKKTDTIDQLVKNVNAESGVTGVRLSYDSNMDRLFFVTSSTGASSKIDLKSANTDLLDNVLKLTSSTSSTKGKTVTGTQSFNATSVIDNKLTANQTLRIKYDGNNYDLAITKDTTADQIIDSINGSGLGKLGVSAYLDPAGKLAFFLPDKSKSISFEDTKVDTTNIVSTLGLSAPTTNMGTSSTVSGSVSFATPTSVITPASTPDQAFRITYDGTDYDFTITETTDITQLIDDINASALNTAKGVTASLDASGKLVLNNPNNAKTFTFTDTDSDGYDTIAALGLTSPTTVYGGISYEQVSVAGTDAEIEYNGVTTNYSSNSFVINGVSFTVKAKTTAEVDVTVSQDTDAVFNSIKGFIDKYNQIISDISGELNEEKYRSYQPLTDEQKKEMKDKDIENWEAKAKSGTLRRDSILENALLQFRTALSGVVQGLPSGDINQLSQIGIDSMNYQDKGKLYIDEAKLKAALASDPEQVKALFTADDGNSTTDSGDGIAKRLYNLTDTIFTQIKDKAGSTGSILDSYLLGRQTKEIDNQISSMNRRLTAMEERYYKQFTAMEKALSQMNAQSASLMQSMGGSAQ